MLSGSTLLVTPYLRFEPFERERPAKSATCMCSRRYSDDFQDSAKINSGKSAKGVAAPPERVIIGISYKYDGSYFADLILVTVAHNGY